MSALRSTIQEMSSEDLSTCLDRRLEADVVELLRSADMIQAEVARRVAEVDRRRTFEADGFLSTGAWLSGTGDMGAAMAARQVGTARRLHRMPLTGPLWASGDISTTKVSILSTASEAFPDRFGEDESTLLQFAAELRVADFRRAIRYWIEIGDQQAASEDFINKQRHAWLHVSRTYRGMVRIDGQLDPESGETLITALGAITAAADRASSASAAAGGPIETAATRRAAGLTEICRQWLDRGASVNGAERPHVTVTVDLATLQGGRGDQCELAVTGTIPAETARRIACDAIVTRIITGPGSEPLDVGRARRSVGPAQRKALTIRDRGCRFPGCDRPPPWCDGHHIQPWSVGGGTDLSNLVLLCRRHHALIHEGGFAIDSEDRRMVFRRPDGTALPGG
jgi:hypothetical protein